MTVTSIRTRDELAPCKIWAAMQMAIKSVEG